MSQIQVTEEEHPEGSTGLAGHVIEDSRTSELTALVAALGFAAAGIAFALQNVILAVAGYFSMVAPNASATA